MGLRIWRDPDDDASAEDAAAKLDRAAATRRSTIRREASVRPNRDHVPPQSISGFLRNRHQNLTRARDRLRYQERQADSQIAQLQAELERLRQIRHRNIEMLSEHIEASRAGRDPPELTSPTGQLSPDENVESNRDISQDASRNSLPRPPRESNLRFELLPSSTSRSPSPWRSQMLAVMTMPSPPRSADSERRDTSIPDGPIPGESWSTDGPRMPALTEGFAPARASPQSRSHNEGHTTADEFLGLETPPPEFWEAAYPPLQRVGHTSPRPAQRVDGLGDRRRSVSSFSDQAEEDTWMSNLLTTMDTSRTSSATSFSSSQGDTTGRSNNSSQTTSISFGEIGSTDETCLDLPEGISQEDARAIREQHRSTRPHSSSVHSNLIASLRRHIDEAHGTEIGMFSAILSRMGRREPIPAEWWATVGLPPDFGRRIQ